jgi:hypothetical protein
MAMAMATLDVEVRGLMRSRIKMRCPCGYTKGRDQNRLPWNNLQAIKLCSVICVEGRDRGRQWLRLQMPLGAATGEDAKVGGAGGGPNLLSGKRSPLKLAPARLLMHVTVLGI